MGREKKTESKVKKESKVFIKSVQKRDGSVVPFDFGRIKTAILKAMTQTKEGNADEAELVAHKVYANLVSIAKHHKNFLPHVEGIQDTVENELILSQYVKTAKAYILYREQRSRIREKGLMVPEKVRNLASESKKYFRNSLGEFIFYRTYARWIKEEGRRETWIETIDRYISFMKENLGKKMKDSEYAELREGILKMEALPSMRLLQFAGTPARTTNVCAYNCSYTAPESWRDVAEVMYLSMCGTGVGWSVESQNVQKLPQIKLQTGKKMPTHSVADSKEGWCEAFLLGMETWSNGNDIEFDFSKVRPEGARLNTMGGKASGPAPLQRLLEFTRATMFKKQGRRLSNLDVHDIICMVGDCVVSGGVRRSAMISLSDLDDELIRDAKKGQFYVSHPHRMLANNSAVYKEKPTNAEFLNEWVALMNSGSGERGIFNRGSLLKQLPKSRIDAIGDLLDESKTKLVGLLGTNPCGEIILRPKQFCNLSEVVARKEDTVDSLMKKVRLATILGTYQSSLTVFPYLSKEWKENCERERLLGVSITGQWDCPALRSPEVMRKLRAEAVRVNKIYAKKFGINPSTAITCVKPSGTASQLVDCSSGMHPRHSPFYIRRVRISATDSLFKMLRDQGVPYHPEIGQTAESATTFVLEFPVRAPGGSVFKDDQTAIEQLEYWKMVKENYTHHNPSVTISVGDDEWVEVANWVYKNWDMIGGLSFLPRDNHVYKLAPYEAIDEKKYNELLKRFEKIDYSKIITYERQDETEAKKELACSAGVCEIAI